MKICVLTQPLYTNYGGLLQAYALQTVLIGMGYDVVTDKDGAKPRLSWLQRPIYFLYHFLKLYILGDKRYNPYLFMFKFMNRKNDELRKRNSVFTDEFIHTHINTINFFSKGDKPDKETLRSFDALIVGSDQVWRPAYSYCPAYFLNFSKDYALKRIAYAASFGVDNINEYNKKLLASCRMNAKLFDAISVREDSAIKLCKRHFHVEAVQVLDPTLLLEKKDYLKLAEDTNEVKRKNSLVYYILDRSESKLRFVYSLAKTLGLPTMELMPKEGIFPSVSNWLAGFRDADFIVTDSFHGTVFSIIFNKPFIAIANEDRGKTRFVSLLKIFDLTDRLISDTDASTEVYKRQIDYSRVNEIREEWRDRSLSFLKSNLQTE